MLIEMNNNFLILILEVLDIINKKNNVIRKTAV